MNTIFKFIFAICISISFETHGQASDSSATEKTQKPLLLFHFNHYPPFSFQTNSLSHFTGERNHSQKFSLKQDFQDYSLFRFSNAPFERSVDYNSLNWSNFVYHYDPANPYGVRNPFEGIVDGSIDYLFWKLFEDK